MFGSLRELLHYLAGHKEQPARHVALYLLLSFFISARGSGLITSHMCNPPLPLDPPERQTSRILIAHTTYI